MRCRTRRGVTNSQEDERDEEDMGGAFVYSFKQWNLKLNAMVENYNENGIDGFFIILIFTHRFYLEGGSQRELSFPHKE